MSYIYYVREGSAYSVYKVQGRKGRSSKLKWFSIEVYHLSLHTIVMPYNLMHVY